MGPKYSGINLLLIYDQFLMSKEVKSIYLVSKFWDLIYKFVKTQFNVRSLTSWIDL